MRWTIPLPFGEIRIRVRRTRKPRAFFWYTLASILLHVVFVSLVAGAILHAFVNVKQPQQEPVMVAISSAMRIEHRTRPMRANHPLQRPQPRFLPQPAQALPQPQARQQPRPELSKPARVAYVQPKEQTQQALTQEQIDAQTRAFAHTIAQARAASDPVAGAAQSNVVPSAPKRYRLNIQGNFGPPQPEGLLTPIRRWNDGPYVYYYVRYDVEYADGTTETGNVPWPIRFPIGDDPFARGIRRMALPGPLPGYVLPAGVALDPLTKNCYDHRYPDCPIAHE